MKQTLFILCWVIGILHCHTVETDSKLTPTQEEPTAAAQVANIKLSNVAIKDKRQIGTKDTEGYANHRSDAEDDPETPQESIYGSKPNQFIIRPIAPHQHQQHEDQQQPQLRNYPATIRPHSSQLLEQSQEIQHFAYLQDISRNHAKTAIETVQPSKSASSQTKKSSKSSRAHSSPISYRNTNANGNAEEAEQRYAVAIQPPQHPHYQPGSPYPLAPLPAPTSHQPTPGQSQPHPYQVIPEEQFLKLIEEELQARAYHDEQIRQQHGKAVAPQPTERAGSPGLGSYRQQQLSAPDEAGTPQYVQYVPRHRGGPKYLPLPQSPQQAQVAEAEEQQEQREPPSNPHSAGIPPQLAYYQPQISYKTLPNHPLAKSSLENEIEKLLAANKESVQLVDNSNEPSANVHQHHQLPQPQTRAHRPLLQHKVYASAAPTAASPAPLLDANNQPFIPSLFKFSNFQPPTPIYPTQVPPQVVEAKKLGPVVYPTQQPTAQPQPTQYYYQEIAPTPKPKAYRSKQYGNKVSPTAAKPRERDYNYPSTSAASKYAAPLIYDFERQSESQQATPAQFHPSPPDPNQPQALPEPTHATAPAPAPPSPPQHSLRPYALPAAAPSRSSIYVSQGTGISTPSYPTTIKPKTVDDVRQLRLPQPGGKPLTQAEFQALVDAGYPVTAVPVPVPVPYEQYVRAHPEYRNQPPVDYAQLMHRLARQYVARRNPHSQASEPSLKIVSSASEPQTATAVGGGSITYLRPIPEGDQKRHPREDKETAVAGKVTESEKQ